MYEDEIMETVTRKVEDKRTRKDICIDILYAVNLILAGVAAGIALCKFCPEFWWFVNWGISV